MCYVCFGFGLCGSGVAYLIVLFRVFLCLVVGFVLVVGLLFGFAA